MRSNASPYEYSSQHRPINHLLRQEQHELQLENQSAPGQHKTPPRMVLSPGERNESRDYDTYLGIMNLEPNYRQNLNS